MDEEKDLLQVKIEEAKMALPVETRNALAAVDWKLGILELRIKKGYTFEQLGDLETETELLLCGLLSPEKYPKELENRMGISKREADELVNEMNTLVFQKIREEIIKNSERKKIFVNKGVPKTPEVLDQSVKIEKNDVQILKSAGIEIVEEHKPLADLKIPEISGREELLELPPVPNTPHPDPLLVKERGDTVPEMHPILSQKLFTSSQSPTVKTEHSLDNITKTNAVNPVSVRSKIPNVDPYRELPE